MRWRWRLSIEGPGESHLTVAPDPEAAEFRILEISPDVDATIVGLTVTGGVARVEGEGREPIPAVASSSIAEPAYRSGRAPPPAARPAHVGGIPYDRWLRFAAPLLLMLMAAAAAALVIAVLIGYS